MLFVGLLAGLAAKSVADPDLWGHIRFGEDILAAGSIITFDPYSFTSDQPWTNHEWLAEILMAVAYRHGGGQGLLLLPCAATLLVLLLTARVLLKSGVGEPATAGLLAVVFVGLGAQLAGIRPQLFSALLFALLMVLLKSVEEGSPRRLVWIVPIFAAWANLHGGWIVGLGVVSLWALLAGARGRIPLLWAALAPCFALAGSILNPYGWGLWLFLWQTVGIERSGIEDWQPIFTAPTQLLPWCLTAVVVCLAWRRRRARAVHLFIPVAMLGLLALKVVRLDVSFVLATVILLGPLLAGLGPSRFELSKVPNWSDLLVVGLLMTAGLLVAASLAWKTANCLPLEGDREIMPEPEAVLFAQRNRLNGNMVSWFNYGEYAIWHLAPALKVSFDGRRETVYSDPVRESHLRFYRGEASGYPVELGADYVWLANSVPAVSLLANDGWIPIFRGPRSVIFSRLPGAHVDVASFSGPRCFPGP